MSAVNAFDASFEFDENDPQRASGPVSRTWAKRHAARLCGQAVAWHAEDNVMLRRADGRVNYWDGER